MPSRNSVKAVPRIIKLVLTGCLTGSMLSIAGCHWLLWAHDEDEFEFCDEVYAECMASAESALERRWCEDDVRACYEACDGRWEDGGGGPADDDSGDQADDNGTTSHGSDDGSNDDGYDDGETGDDPSVCIALFGNCINTAQTLQDVEACEALFDHCIDPGECPDSDCGGCPTESLQACLDTYASCASLADTPEKIEACGAGFDQCTAPFAAECQVDENPNLEPCLEQHELCVACADDEDQLAACQIVFDSCMA